MSKGQKRKPHLVDLVVTSQDIIDRILTLELVRVTERAAVAAARLRGRGDEKAADQAAVDAMRRELQRLPIDGTVVIGEGERDEAPMLYIGEKLGTSSGPKVDIAVDPLEGTTLCARDMPGSIAVMAMATGGSLLHAPDVYMEKIAIGPFYPQGVVDLDMSPEENIRALAKAKGVSPREISVLVLDRPRHKAIMEDCRRVGAALRIIPDGDIAGVIFTTRPEETGIDLYLGIGGAPEGVVAAGALRCVGGQMQGRLILDSQEKIDRASEMGVADPRRKYDMKELAAGDVIVSLTGVTDGPLLAGVKFAKDVIRTETLIYRSVTGTVRKISAEHREMGKFKLA
jgi:fructose-1,6-bisphosphatase II / sedoheptulose-1,7-bisphosphatase